MRSTRSRRTAVRLALCLAVLGLFPASNAAAAPRLVVCTAAGALSIVPNPPGPAANQWTLIARGSCLGDQQGTYFVDVTALGSSDSLGLCDDVGVVMNLELTATVTMTSTSDPSFNKFFTEDWFAPITTFPYAVPFIDADNGDLVGAGVIVTRIVGNCPPAGSPSAWLEWTRTV